MKLSSKGRYGLKAMCELAKHYGEGALSLPYIAGETLLSDKYLEQLLSVLKKDNLIDATRGASGGYFLKKAPEEISVGEILRSLENGLEIVDCLSGDCQNKATCHTYGVWSRLYKEINKCLDGISLKQLVEGE